LKPGPLTKTTRKGWIRRLTSKELEKTVAENEAAGDAKTTPVEDPFNFSADEEALSGAVKEAEDTTPAAEANTQTSIISPKADEDFSDNEDESDDGEQSSDSKSEENNDPEPDADTTPSAMDITEMHQESENKSPLDTTGVEMEGTIKGDEENQSGKSSPVESSNENSESEKKLAETQSVTETCCVSNTFNYVSNYLRENAQDIIEFTVILLLAYFLFKKKADIQPYFNASMKRIQKLLESLAGNAGKTE